MVTPTFYNVLVPDDRGNEKFYRAISEAVGLPIIIYNVIPQNEIAPSCSRGCSTSTTSSGSSRASAASWRCTT